MSNKSDRFFKLLAFIFILEASLFITKFLNILPWPWHWVLAPFWIVGGISSLGSFILWVSGND